MINEKKLVVGNWYTIKLPQHRGSASAQHVGQEEDQYLFVSMAMDTIRVRAVNGEVGVTERERRDIVEELDEILIDRGVGYGGSLKSESWLVNVEGSLYVETLCTRGGRSRRGRSRRAPNRTEIDHAKSLIVERFGMIPGDTYKGVIEFGVEGTSPIEWFNRQKSVLADLRRRQVARAAAG